LDLFTRLYRDARSTKHKRMHNSLTIRKHEGKRTLGRPKHKWQDKANTSVSRKSPIRVIIIIIYLHFMSINITRRWIILLFAYHIWWNEVIRGWWGCNSF